MENLNDEIRITFEQTIDKLKRQEMLDMFGVDYDKIMEASKKIICWHCMDKELVYAKRGLGAWMDGRGTHDLYGCLCKNDDNFKWHSCSNMDFISGRMFCRKDDYGEDKQDGALRMYILKDKL